MIVTDVMHNFRRALLAVLPAVDQARVSWRRPEAYDAWDAIASVLFNALVVDVVRWTLPETLHEAFELPDYDLVVASYAGLYTVEVTHPTLAGERSVFHAFGSVSAPFDVVEVREVSSDGVPVTGDLVVCPVEGARFWLRPAPAAEAGSGSARHEE